MNQEFYVRKKSGNLEDWNAEKIVKAVTKSADRAGVTLSDEENSQIVAYVEKKIFSRSDNVVSVEFVHSMVESALKEVNPMVAESYRDYRNWVKKNAEMMKKVREEGQEILNRGDKSNSNADSALCSTQGAKIRDVVLTTEYEEYFLNANERKEAATGYIYFHDKNLRLLTANCCLFDMENVLNGGFEMGNIWYNEPKTLDVAFDVIGDVVLSASSQQYGGFTVPCVDAILDKYAEMSYQMYLKKYSKLGVMKEAAEKEAYEDVVRDMMQGFQGWEYKFNTVASSRGDYPFITISFGLRNTRWGKEACKACLRVRAGGQGKKEHKKPVLFPKLVFLYDKNLHDKGMPMEDVFEEGVICSSKTMYPDWLSLTGEGYVAEQYKKYGAVISPMGCRAFLSPWFERGGMEPADENDKPIYTGRFNIGVVSLNLPMILAKSRRNCTDFYEELDYYLEMIRKVHLRTYDYLGNKKASINPLGFCEGGFYGGHLKLNDKIAPCLESATASFGVTALNELQELYNGKSIVEDGQFALEVMDYINKRITEFKKEDHRLYATYGSPAESLCFAGDTLVQTYEGDKKIKDIKVGDLVYSFNEEKKKIELKPVIYSGMTKAKASVVKVHFTNGQSVICTPEHKFAKRKVKQNEKGVFSGSEYLEYTMAQNLKPGDRIKSNYITINVDGHYRCSTYQYIHNINAEYFLGEKPSGYVTHHKDEDKLNNAFENLEYIADADHRRHHMSKGMIENQYTRESVLGSKNPFWNKKHSEEAKEKNRQKHLGKMNVNSKQVIKVDMDGNIIQIYESRGIAERENNVSNISYACNGLYAAKENPHEFKGFLWYYSNNIKDFEKMNHIVESVEFLEEEIPVYDITVEDNHNFYVGGKDGILVHNCGTQIKQFRKEFGIITNVSDRPYVSNSFHCHVSENISPIKKQDLENRFWDKFNGGKIQYCRYHLNYNIESMKTLIKRAMDMGFYEGVNLSLAYCDDCGHQELEMDVCPKCGSRNLTKIDRMNGYLSYSRVHGDTRLNEAKMAEIAERVSM